MVAFDWRKWFRQQFCTTRRSIRRRPTRRLNLEKLEERWVPSITATGQNVSMIEGTANPVLLATFTDTDPSPVADYSVSINWGDGTGSDTTSATVSQNGNTYFITASHTYAEETPAGTPNAVTVNIAESNGSDTDSATANSTANVADAALTAIPTTITPAEGAAFSGTVAAFTDADPNGTATDYSATIKWGDGSTTTGTIAVGTGSLFNVNGSHTYAEDGTYSVTVTILDQGGSSAVAHSTANVTETDLNVTASSFSAAEGTALTNVQVATFTDTGRSPTDTFSATIAWGDGTTTAGTIIFNSATATYTVTGSHTYADEGSFTVTTTVTETGVTPSSSASVAITVADRDNLTVNALAVSAVENAPFSGVVAKITDTFDDSPSDFTASISWGDGHTSAGTVARTGSGAYTVSGSHTYTEEGTYHITVTIHDDAAGAATASNSNTASVSDPAVNAIGGFTVTASEGSNSGSQTVATFTDPAGPEALSNYRAIIAWGDGSTSTGSIAFNSANSTFTVSGSHTYAEEGNPTITVTIKHDTAPNAVVTSSALVSDPSVNATGGFTLSAAEGSSTGTQTVATFTDPGGAEALSNYSATISWGDNSTSTGTITFNAATNTFTVSGSHTYTEEGGYTLTVTINHDTAPAIKVTDVETVSDPSVIATGGFSLNAVEGGSTGTQTVATFTDPAGAEALSNYSANINWGDNSTSAGTITFNTATGVFTVSGSHIYAEEGNHAFAVTIIHDIASPATVIDSAKVSDPSVNATGGFSLTAAEGSSTGTQTVATFTDPGGPEALTDYSAIIHWGDSTSSTGTITFNTGTGVFTVSGSHTYAEEGGYGISVTINHDMASPVTVNDSATVSDPSVNATGGFSLTAAEGSSTGTQTVATFTDPGGPEPVANYSATIAWGDATSSTGAITFNATNSTFTVSGSHTYIEEGGYGISVTIHHESSSPVTVTDSAMVSDPSVIAQGGFTITASEGTNSGTQTVATFTDPGGAEPLSDYSASIAWGDGQTTTNATISSTSGGGFAVSGDHTYAEEGTYTISVTIHHDSASPVTVTDTAAVSDPSVNAIGGITVSGTEGLTVSNQTVAAFTDPAGAEAINPTNYSATIAWGDGHTSAGIITQTGSGLFKVTGSHQYTEEGSFTIAVTVHHDQAADVTVTDTANVADATLTPIAKTITPGEGAAFSGTVASFTDANPIGTVSDFSATIMWGDGSTTTGTIAAGTGNSFNVNGSHTYGEDGTYSVTVTILDQGGSSAVANSTANVTETDLTVTASSISPTEGTAFTDVQVATFTDTGRAPADTFSATIAWGDGSTSTGSVSFSTPFNASVKGSHTYADEGSFTVTITVTETGVTPSSSASEAISVADADSLTVNALPVSATENAPFSGVVANVTDTFDNSAADLTANISWGDGNTTTGMIAKTGTGAYTVSGSHTYAEEGPYTVTVTVNDDAPSTVSVSNSSTATVADPSVNAVGNFTVTANEGSNSGSETVATFTDPAGPEPIANYSATIGWGDGATSSGTITFNTATGVFTVSGSHTYAEEGTDTIMVTMNHETAPAVSVTSTAQIADVAVAATGGFTVTAAEGSNSGSQTVATFTDPAGSEPVANYSATIAWGDGATSSGTITFDTATGVFTVSGSHTYAEEGTDMITVTVHHETAPDASASSTAQIADVAVVATGGFTVTAAEGASSGSQTVATFTDPAGAEALSNYSATIAWGDGSTSSGTITFNSTTGIFTVSGSHTYIEEGTDTITVTIDHETAPSVSVTSTAQVSDQAVAATGGFTVTASEGSSSGSQTVATFTDPAGAEALSNYSATIAWGDGASSSGTITFNSATGVFTVSGIHTYAEEGSDTITVTIHHETAPNVSVTSTAQIADVAVVATGGFHLQSAEKSSTGIQTVATFTDPAGTEPVANYAATISWGDGSSSAGTITFNSGTEVFTVAGSHTYAEQGTFTITTTIQHETAPAVTATSSALVHLVSDIAGRIQENGNWWVATSNGSTAFSNTFFGTWDPTRTWVDVLTGDFNGDGRTDYVARDSQTGQVFVALSTGSSFTTTLWTTWAPNVTWADVRVGDFTGDGKDDLVGRVASNGQVWVGASTGSSFTNTLWTTWYAGVTWSDVRVGDFTGDGKADLAGRVQASGDWWVAQSSGSSFTNIRWTTWDPSVNWVDVQVGDFNGDGKADIAGRDLAHGAWWVAVSSGSSFSNTLWTIWDPTVTWVDVRVGDFNGDGKADLVGRISQNGQIWVSLSTGSSFMNSMWTTWDPSVTWVDVQAGDFNGDGKADIAGRDQATGAWWVGLSNGSTAFTTTLWTIWDPKVTWVDVHAGDFA